MSDKAFTFFICAVPVVMIAVAFTCIYFEMTKVPPVCAVNEIALNTTCVGHENYSECRVETENRFITVGRLVSIGEQVCVEWKVK